MTTAYTTLLGLALPVQGELQGTWGDEVNNYITNYLDAAVAGTQTISGSQTAVTLSKTTGSSLSQAGSGATGSSQYFVINCTGNPAGTLTITAPAASKAYLIINATSTTQDVKIVGAGPTTGVTLVSGERAIVSWNGSDFVKVANFGGVGSFTTISATTGNITTVNSTTVDTTNIEVTTLKAKDGTAAGSIANSTGVVTLASSVLTTADINGGTMDNVTIGGATPAAGNFTNLDATGTLAVDGNVTLGDASTDIVQVNGYMGVGGTPTGNIGLQIFSSGLTGAGPIGIASTPVGPSTALTSVRAVFGRADTAAASFTVADVMQFQAANSNKGAGSTITNQHGVYITDQTQGTNNYGITSAVSSGSNKWNIYASGTAANYFAGNVGIGTSSPGSKLSVSGAGGTYSATSGNTILLQVENASVGATGNAALLNFRASAGDTNITGFVIGTVTAATGNAPNFVFQQRTGATTYAERLRITSGGDLMVGTTSGTRRLTINDATTSYLGYQIAGSEKWVAGVDASNRYIIFDTTASLNRLMIDASGNVKIGGSADRASTVGTNHLDIFNGTAPVGTLSNGISIYSSAGEAYVMDAAGNATLFSPHDAETNEWIFKSKHTPTGKVLKIDVERLLRFVNDHFGLDAVQEFIED